MEAAIADMRSGSMSAAHLYVQQLLASLDKASDRGSRSQMVATAAAAFAASPAALEVLDAVLFDVWAPLAACASDSQDCADAVGQLLCLAAQHCTAREVLALFMALLDLSSAECVALASSPVPHLQCAPHHHKACWLKRGDHVSHTCR